MQSIRLSNGFWSFLISSFMVTMMINLPTTRISQSEENEKESKEDLYGPADQFFLQRSWPEMIPDFRAYESGLKSVMTSFVSRTQTLPGFNSSWTLEGPGNIGGRVNVLAINPTNQDIIFAGCASGGIFRTTDGGVNWAPVFDGQTFLSIGTIVFDPTNTNIIYAGTGDPNISGYPFIGDGIWKSVDGGDTWTHLGLTDQRIISKICIDPTNTSVIYAATMGIPFERNNDRGLYKSTDGGLTWNQVLFISNQAGIIDMVMDPNNPQVLYAAGWDRIRNNQESLIIGQGAKIYKTTDGGVTWNILTNGLPQQDMSRIGIAISSTNSNVLYAVYVNDALDFDGVYKTTDGGQNWTLQPSNGIDPFFMGGFGWYFGRIAINPQNDNQIFVCGIQLYKSDDSGNNWTQSDVNFVTHSDKHDIRFLNSNTLLLATDGGIYKSTNGGIAWNDFEDLPNSQFYRVACNPFQPGVYTGGLQDNGTCSGNASTINNWQRIFGADGFTPLFNPVNPDVFYVETQNGDIWSTSDGGNFFDYISNNIDPTDRRNWDMQYIMSNFDPDVLYTGTFRVYKNTTGPIDSWTPISPDLTDGLIFEPRFHTISSISESALNADVLYVGTTDGNAWNTLDGGNNWNNITGTLPDRYVTSIKASPNNAQRVFVSLSGYKYNDFIPHIFKSDNQGTTWIDISGNLPQIAVNDILIYPGNDNIILVATDGGVFATVNGGAYWERVGNNMPVFPVYDIDLETSTHKIIAGTHARSLMSYSADSLLLATGIQEAKLHDQLVVYPNPATDYLNIEFPSGTVGGSFVEISDLAGREIKKISFKGSKIPVDMLKSGKYHLHVLTNKGFMSVSFVKI